jgi:hypothetical protein
MRTGRTTVKAISTSWMRSMTDLRILLVEAGMRTTKKG